MQTMYSGKVNSPATTLDGGINDVVTTINIVNGSVLPSAPNIAVIGTGEDSETILYATKVVNQLSNITRGFQGIAKEWSTGEAIARLFTEYDYNALKGNIGTIAGRKITDFGECNSEELRSKITDETGTGKAVFGTYPNITKINLTEGQIKFPAIVNPSSDSNTQDDYEEGEHTVTLTCGTSGTITLSSTYNKIGYTKIGRNITITGQIEVVSVSSPLGSLSLSLPFVSANLSARAGITVGTVGHYAINPLSGTTLIAKVEEGQASAQIRELVAGQNNNDVANHMKAGSSLFFGITYFNE